MKVLDTQNRTIKVEIIISIVSIWRKYHHLVLWRWVKNIFYIDIGIYYTNTSARIGKIKVEELYLLFKNVQSHVFHP